MTIAPAPAREAISLRCDVTQPWEARVDMLVVIVPVGAQGAPSWLASHAELVSELAEGEHVIIHRGRDSEFLARAVAVAAFASPDSAAARRLGRRIGAAHRSLTSFALAGLQADHRDDAAFAFLSGFSEARYRFERYRSERTAAAEVALLGTPSHSVENLAVDLAHVSAIESAVSWARDLTNTPARDLTPAGLAAEAERQGRASGAAVRVFDETWIDLERFEGLAAVGASSPHPPRLVEFSYRGSAAIDTPPIVLVGKGITFDSGGLSIKSAKAMEEMKSDMAGAATALAVVRAIAEMAPASAHVVAVLPLAENLPGPLALRPGDVIRHRNGKTTEVVNTDCEGRLVMSDAITWAEERSPAAIIDIATLTYSTIVALGMGITSVIGSDSALISDLRAAGTATGDPVWELPLWQPYREHITSSFADLRNEPADDGAGAITAALYLREFVGDTPWAHLDTGGTAYLDEETDDLGVGATGSCVRGLIRFVLDRQCTIKGEV